MLGLEVAVGYALAYLTRKLRRTGGQADAEVDRLVDAAMSRVHALVSRALPDDPALRLATEEATTESGVTDRTRTRLTLALEEALESDADLATALQAAVNEVRSAAGASGTALATGDGIAIAGSVTLHTEGGSTAALRMGDVTVNPPPPAEPPPPARPVI